MKLIRKYTELINKNLLATAFAFGAFVSPVTVKAQGLREAFGNEDIEPDGVDGDLFSIFQTVSNILLILIGAVAVIMLIIGGFRYVASGGDSSAIEGAKNTILYAVIGIVVAFLAYAAINFLTEQLDDSAMLLETIVA